MNTTQIQPGIVEVNLVARAATPAMTIVQHLVNAYTTASDLQRGPWAPAGVYRRIRLNTNTHPPTTSPAPDQEPTDFDLPAADDMARGHVAIDISGVTKDDVDRVHRNIVEAFPVVGTAVSLWDFVRSVEPRDTRVRFTVDTGIGDE